MSNLKKLLEPVAEGELRRCPCGGLARWKIGEVAWQKPIRYPRTEGYYSLTVRIKCSREHCPYGHNVFGCATSKHQVQDNILIEQAKKKALLKWNTRPTEETLRQLAAMAVELKDVLEKAIPQEEFNLSNYDHSTVSRIAAIQNCCAMHVEYGLGKLNALIDKIEKGDV